MHTPCSWAPQHSDTHRGAPILRPRQSYTDTHLHIQMCTYLDTPSHIHTPIHVRLAISSPVTHLSCTHTHSSPHALCLGMLTRTTKYTPSQACTCSTQVWTHKHMQALFLLHSPTHHTDIHPYKSTNTYPHKHTDTHPHACRQHTDGRTDGWMDGQTDTHRSQREPGAARRALAARGSAPHFIDLATGRAEAASFA